MNPIKKLVAGLAITGLAAALVSLSLSGCAVGVIADQINRHSTPTTTPTVAQGTPAKVGGLSVAELYPRRRR
jgi:hypothetical protein